MNYIKLDQPGGFPLETQTFLNMQNAYGIYQHLAALAGDKTIISGCAQIGTTVTDGVIYVNGELLDFRAGQLQTTIIVQEEVVNGEFENGEVKPIYYTRYASFGSGINAINWADFKRVYPLSSGLFIDEVRMYSGAVANIPWGWYLMDGKNGTLDIRDRFPIPYNPNNPDYNTIGKIGGLNEITLTEEQMPAHQHTGVTDYGGLHTHDVKDGQGGSNTNTVLGDNNSPNFSGQDAARAG